MHVFEIDMPRHVIKYRGGGSNIGYFIFIYLQIKTKILILQKTAHKLSY